MSFMKIENNYMRTPEYIDFINNRKFAVYLFLQSAIIRESKEVKNFIHGGHYIYKEHFLKGRLVSRYSQEKIGKYLKTSQGKISERLTKLEQDGLIKKIVRPTKKGNILYYQLGVWEGTYGEASYTETLWSDTIFTGYYEAFRKGKVDQRQQEADDGLLNMFNGDKDKLDNYLKKFEFA